MYSKTKHHPAGLRPTTAVKIKSDPAFMASNTRSLLMDRYNSLQQSYKHVIDGTVKEVDIRKKPEKTFERVRGSMNFTSSRYWENQGNDKEAKNGKIESIWNKKFRVKTGQSMEF